MTCVVGRPTFAAIDAAALRENFALVRRVVPAATPILAVVKADGYGHGGSLVAPVLEAAGADCFGGATVEEGVDLRAAGVHKPIVVLTGAGGGDAAVLREYDLAAAILSREMVSDLADGWRRVTPGADQLSVHIKVDTGMGRLGVLPADV